MPDVATPTKTKAVTPTAAPPARQHTAAAGSGSGEKVMFKMADGKTVELPPGMTAEEAAKTEKEGLAAKSKVGKRSNPANPAATARLAEGKVAEKKKPQQKDVKKSAKDKKQLAGLKGKGKAGAKGAAGKGGGSKVMQFLRAKGLPTLISSAQKLNKLKTNEQTHENAETKTKNYESAQVTPAAENQGKSNAAQVAKVDARKPPEPSEAEAKKVLNDAIAQNMPTKIEDVDNFKADSKGKDMASAALGHVNADVKGVGATFGEMKTTPPPATPETTPVPLPPTEVAPPTPAMGLGVGAVPQIQKEHTDMSDSLKKGDDKMKEEGIKQEELDMVDSGDLAEANKEKKGMNKKAVTGPAEINQFNTQARLKVDGDMKAEEQKEKSNLKKERDGALTATGNKQKEKKSAAEKRREEVHNTINTMSKATQDKVTKRLDDLEKQAMKTFDDGQAKASKKFEDDVKRELDAFKDDRYSGLFGWALRAKDWLLGMEDLPEVEAIFNRNRQIFVDTMQQLVDDITATNKKVIQECKDEIAKTKTDVEKYIKDLGPELQEEARKAQSEMNDKLSALDETINKKEEELNDKLKKKQEDAIKAIDDKIAKMKEEMSGALGKLLKFLLNAMKKFFVWVLGKVGAPTDKIMGIIDKGVTVIKNIVLHPIKFLGNLISGVKTGIGQFATNFPEHLKKGVVDWLTGQLGGAGITLPAVWDAKGFFSLTLQILGLSWQSFRKKIADEIGEEKMVKLERLENAAEKGLDIIQRVKKDGVIALWDMLKDKLSEIKTTVIKSLADWAGREIVKQAVFKIVSMFNPAGAIVQAIIAIYNVIMFFIENWDRIVEFVGSVFDSVAEIANGQIGKAANYIEKTLAKTIPIILAFLARIAGLGKIADAVKDTIKKIRDIIDVPVTMIVKLLVKIAKPIIDFAVKVVDKFDQGKAYVKGKIDDLKQSALNFLSSIAKWWERRKGFKSADGGNHNLFFKGNAADSKVMVASKEQLAIDFLNTKKADPKDTNDKTIIQEGIVAYGDIQTKKKAVEDAKEEYKKLKNPTKDQEHAAKNKINAADTTLYNSFLNLSVILSKLTFTDKINEMVRSHVTISNVDLPTAATALPLTEIPGNTKGTGPSGSDSVPIGWTYAMRLNATKGAGKGDYVKGHLINEDFHGPGVKGNLVPISRSINGMMSTVENNAKKHIKDKSKGNVIWFNTDVSYRQAKSGISFNMEHFPETITVKWGFASIIPGKENQASDINKWQIKDTQENVPIPCPPPLDLGAAPPPSNEFSMLQGGLTQDNVGKNLKMDTARAMFFARVFNLDIGKSAEDVLRGYVLKHPSYKDAEKDITFLRNKQKSLATTGFKLILDP